jgi:hemerythrin-like domain-containing protein
MKMNILTQISNEHREIDKLFESLSDSKNSDSKVRQRLFDRLNTMLSIHTEVEEEVLYEVLEKRTQHKQDVLEAKEEHQLARNLLEELEKLNCKDEKWMPKLIVLKENIEHHVKEEESRIFDYAKQTFGKAQLETLGKEFIDKSKKLCNHSEKAS